MTSPQAAAGREDNVGRRRTPCLVVALVVVAQGHVACSGPRRASRADSRGRWTAGSPAGDNVVEVRAYYGVPILQKSLAWDGNGEVDDVGAGIRLLHDVGQGVSIGGGLTGATWLVGGADAYSIEAEGLLRWYPGIGRAFVDCTGGWQQATARIPPGGTEWNMTFGFGPGVLVPLGEHASLLLGTAYHHVSNALGRDNPRNPSQNEARLWVGLAWNF